MARRALLAMARINIYANLMYLVLIEYQLIQQLNLTGRKIDVDFILRFRGIAAAKVTRTHLD